MVLYYETGGLASRSAATAGKFSGRQEKYRLVRKITPSPGGGTRPGAGDAGAGASGEAAARAVRLR
jgi:hypothetical protein